MQSLRENSHYELPVNFIRNFYTIAAANRFISCELAAEWEQTGRIVQNRGFVGPTKSTAT